MAAPKTEIEKWLSSKTRDYQTGVRLYAAHPTAKRGLVNTFQRKENDFTRLKLAYVLQQAAAADKAGRSQVLKKKELPRAKKAAQKKRLSQKQNQASKAKPAPKPSKKKETTKPSTAKTSTSKEQNSQTASPTSPTGT